MVWGFFKTKRKSMKFIIWACPIEPSSNGRFRNEHVHVQKHKVNQLFNQYSGVKVIRAPRE